MQTVLSHTNPSYTGTLTPDCSVKNARSTYLFGFNGMEKDPEITGEQGSHYTAAFWEYDTRIARRWNLDPKPNPAISQYATFANNPIFYSDPLGDTLDIGNTEQSRNDIESLVKSDNTQYLSFEDNRVSLDFADISPEKQNKLLSDDEGLSLINDLVSSDKKFLYEASDIALYKNASGQKSFTILSTTADGIMNISAYGDDGLHRKTTLPKEGYDGQVLIRPNTKFSEWSGSSHVEKSRASLVFHELDENYLRTHFNYDYHSKYDRIGAHEGAIFREALWHGKSLAPGELSKYPNISLPNNKEQHIKYKKAIDEYMGY